METTNDMYEFISRRWRIPFHLIHLSFQGRHWTPAMEVMPLTDLVGKEPCPPGRERCVWIMWMRDTDYFHMHYGWLIYENLLEGKLAKLKGPKDVVILGLWRKANTNDITQYEAYHSGIRSEQKYAPEAENFGLP